MNSGRFAPLAALAPPLHYALRRPNRPEEPPVDLAVWIPLTVALGLGALGLMVLFVAACDRV
jgi:hypothetical protein